VPPPVRVIDRRWAPQPPPFAVNVDMTQMVRVWTRRRQSATAAVMAALGRAARIGCRLAAPAPGRLSPSETTMMALGKFAAWPRPGHNKQTRYLYFKPLARQELAAAGPPVAGQWSARRRQRRCKLAQAGERFRRKRKK
jgi:hypothetical protein